jgi:hypothetical protein
MPGANLPDMKNKAALLKEMDEALESANRCSEALEKLLKEARDMGRPSPEFIELISSTNKQCDEDMNRYITAYRKYYNVQGK